MTSYRDLTVLGILGALWGASFMFIKVAVGELAPESVVAARLVLAALVLLPVLYWRGLRLPTNPRTWLHLLVVGIFGLSLPFLLITWGEQTIPSGMAAILNATTPLFALLIGYAWLREERMSGMRLLGVGVGFVGVVVAVGLDTLQLGGGGLPGSLAVLLAAACYGFSGLYARRVFHTLPPLVPATGQICVGALLMLPLALLRNGPPTMPSLPVVGALLGLAILCTAIAYILLYWLMARIGATRTSMVTYLLPPFALLYGGLLLGEQVGVGTIAGLLLVFAGILLANGALRWPIVIGRAGA